MKLTKDAYGQLVVVPKDRCGCLSYASTSHQECVQAHYDRLDQEGGFSTKTVLTSD